jgi:hypothetical protein
MIRAEGGQVSKKIGMKNMKRKRDQRQKGFKLPFFQKKSQANQ